MHENLKYTLKLDEKIQAFNTFEGMDPKNPEDKAQIADWQPIYAHKHYGTLFLIYAKFLGKKVKEGFEVDRVQLYIQNYEGEVTLGFTQYAELNDMQIEANDPDIDPRYPNRKKYKLSIGLQALNTENVIRNYRTMERVVLQQGDVIMTQPFFLPVANAISRIFDGDHINKSLFVDPVFMKRDGDEVYITQQGEMLLRDLLNGGHVERKDLFGAGIDPDSPQTFENFGEQKNRTTICQPVFSQCDIP
jgi:hypothetical protein